MLSVAEKPMAVKEGLTALEFVDQLQQDCLDHPALNHSYLKKFEAGKVNKGQITQAPPQPAFARQPHAPPSRWACRQSPQWPSRRPRLACRRGPA